MFGIGVHPFVLILLGLVVYAWIRYQINKGVKSV